MTGLTGKNVAADSDPPATAPTVPRAGAGPRPRPARALLRDGSSALLEPLGPADLDELLALHDRLSERDRYLRFATLHPGDLPGYLRRTLDPAGGDLTLGARVRGRLVGAVQLLPVGGGAAEVAAVVDAEGRLEGVATVLLEALAAAARRMGVDRFQADILAENGPMLRVLADLGLPVVHTREGSGVRIEVGLRPDEPYELAAEERHRTAAAASLQPVFRPRSVAVIGAGRAPGSVGRAVLRSLRDGGFPGPVHAVNPAAEEIEGFPCVPSVQALPEPAELAVIAVPATAVGEVVTDCGRAGVRALLVLSGGLAEVPGLPELVRDLVARHGMRLVGPNSVGVVTPGEPAQLNASFAGQHPSPGDIGLVAQSGGIVIAAVAAWQRLGLGLSSAAAIGDAYDVGARDVLAWFDEDPATQLVVLYAESEPDLRGLARTAAHLAARVPVLALESATSGAGARAAASHTARAATPHAVREAAYASAGIQSLPDLTSLAATAHCCAGSRSRGSGRSRSSPTSAAAEC